MKNHILDDVAPVQLNEALLIPVKINTVKLFGTDQIKFQILFNGRKIKIESPEILANQDSQDNHQLQQEPINVNKTT